MCVLIYWDIGPKGTYQWCRLEAAEGHSTRAGWQAHSLLWWTGQHICHRLISVKETAKRHRREERKMKTRKDRKERGEGRRLGDNRHFSDFKRKLKWGFKRSWLQKGEYHKWLKRMVHLQLLNCATWGVRGTPQPGCLLTVLCQWRGSRASDWCWWWSQCLYRDRDGLRLHMVKGFGLKVPFTCWSVILIVRWLFLTIGFAFLPWVAVVKDALGVVCPGQAAEFNPLQYVRQ